MADLKSGAVEKQSELTRREFLTKAGKIARGLAASNFAEMTMRKRGRNQSAELPSANKQIGLEV